MIYWPGTNIAKSVNDFTAHERLEHSCMWPKGEEKRAQELAKRAAKLTVEQRQKETTIRKPFQGANDTKLSKTARAGLRGMA